VVYFHFQGRASFARFSFSVTVRLRFNDNGIAGNGIKATDFIAGSALDAFAFVQIVHFGTGPVMAPWGRPERSAGSRYTFP